MQIESKDKIVAVKAYSRGNALPLDASELYDSLSEAQAYAKAANAYEGQTIKAKLEDGKFHTYTLQPSESGLLLEEVGADIKVKQHVQIVDALPTKDQEQEVIYIVKTTGVGSIWNGTAYKEVFRDVTADLATKAPINNPNFTGTATIGGKEIATKEYAESLVAGLNSFETGIVDNETPLPTTGYKVGQTFRVAEAGTYAGVKCEIGDLIIVVKNHAAEGASNDDFMVLQANIDGAVTSSATSAVDGEIVVFDGATGKVVKSSKIAISSLQDVIAKAHTHSNKTYLDTYDVTKADLLAKAKAEAMAEDTKIKEALEGQIGNVYTKAETDALLTPIKENLNSKVDAATVDEKIKTAKTELETAFDEKIGEIPENDTVKDYVDRVAGTGSADVAEQISQAKADAIAESKAYTDTALTIVEF